MMGEWHSRRSPMIARSSTRSAGTGRFCPKTALPGEFTVWRRRIRQAARLAEVRISVTRGVDYVLIENRDFEVSEEDILATCACRKPRPPSSCERVLVDDVADPVAAGNSGRVDVGNGCWEGRSGAAWSRDRWGRCSL